MNENSFNYYFSDEFFAILTLFIFLNQSKKVAISELQIEVEGFHMTNNHKTLFTDEILHFLYSNTSFHGLCEEEQLQFLERFQTNDVFREMVEIAIALEETITEVEATMPKIQQKDLLLPQTEQKELLKSRMVVEDNVYYVPFEVLDNIYSPIVIAIQQSTSMKEFEAFCKGTILPLFNLSASQKRDLILLPFNETVNAPITFKNGKIQLSSFIHFMDQTYVGEAKIVPVIERAIELFKEDSIDNQRDLMILTDNQFTDFQALIATDFVAVLAELQVDVSVVAMSEIDFEVQPIPFADKVYFANE